MSSQKGFAHLLLPLLIVALVVLGALLVVKHKGKLALPLQSTETKVTVKTEYKNPFDKKDQYVNPFDQYKSPLYELKK